MLRAMSDLLNAEGFVVGLIVALAVAGVIAFLGHRFRIAIVAGTAAVVGTLAGFVAEDRWSWPMLGALVLLGVGAELGAARGTLLAALAALPGALLLGAVLPSRVPDWGFPVVAAAAVIATVFVVQFDRELPRRFVPLLTITGLGVYGAVPDTEYARAFVGGLLGACALVLLPRIRGRAGAAAALTGLWAWASVAGGYARPASVVGALGCLGVLAIAPIVGPTLQRAAATWAGAVTFLLLQAIVAGICSRVAGLSPSTLRSGVIVVIVWAAAFAVLGITGRGTPASPRR